MRIETLNELNELDKVLDFLTPFANFGGEKTRDELIKAIIHADDFVLVAKDGESICGVFAFFVEQQTHYLELTHVFSDNEKSYKKLFEHLSSNYESLQLDVVIKHANPLLEQTLKSIDGTFYPVQIKMVLDTFKEYKHDLEIVGYDPKYRHDYLSLHSTDVSWTGERVLYNLDIFKVLLAVQDNQVVGYVDTAYKSVENEPYDLFVKVEYRNKGYGKALVSEMVKAVQSKNIFVYVDEYNIAAIKVYCSIGFVITQERIQTVSVKL